MLLPTSREALRSLEAGDEVLLEGTVLTMRDASLRRLKSELEGGGGSPFELDGHMVFHAGPSPPAAGRPAGSIGPTTSARMDQYLEMLFDCGVLATLGKGPRGEEAARLHRERGAVYLAAVGGLGAFFGGMVEDIVPVAWEDLGPEAVYVVKLKGFPALVAIDSQGADHLARQHLLYRGQME